MARWTQILAATAAKMQRRSARKRSSTVAPHPIPFSTAASKGGRLPRSNVAAPAAAPVPHLWFVSLLAKMRCGGSSADRRRAPSSKGVPKKASKKLQSNLSCWAISSTDAENGPAPPPSATSGSASKTPKAGSATFSGKASVATSSASPTACSATTSSAFPTACSATTSSASPTACSATSLETCVAASRRGSACLPPAPPSPSLSFRDHEEDKDDRSYKNSFNDYWYKVIALGGAVMAFLYGELKDIIEKEVDNKVKENELKDKDRLLSEKQEEINKKDVEIRTLQTRLQEKKNWFF